MPTPSPNDIPSLSEIILNWTFRENGSIFIPKSYRQEAVIMQLDIRIVSVAREQYLSYESSPASGYYGYATLVMRDFCLPPIKIEQPRQTLFYQRLDDVIVNWWSFYRAIVEADKFKGIESLICDGVVAPLGGTCAAKECVPIVPPSWVEIPLREVYINSHYGTQFQLELSYWKFGQLLDNCGNLVSNNSGQADGDKDGGLPPFGSQPNKASDPNNPYDGLQPASTQENSPLGFRDSDKQDNLNNTDPDNLPTDPNQIPAGKSYWVKMAGSYKDFGQGCATVPFEQYFSLRSYDDTVRAVTDSFVSDSCGGILVTAGRILSNLDDFQYGNSTGGGNYVASYLRSDTTANPFL